MIIGGFELENMSLSDAIFEIQDIRRNLAKSHGRQFRELDRLIDNLSERDDLVAIHNLGEGVLMSAPGPAFTSILKKARALGVAS